MNPSFGTNAQGYKVKRVLYEGTNTIYMGMALCYNHDTTTNVLGSNKATGARGTTTADGYQNEGKWKRVEEPSAANQRFFAGVVSDSKDLNMAGSGSSWVDIYVPNGAIVAVRTDKSVSNGDGAYLEPGENTIINYATAGGVQVGWFMETIDRSSTAGLALVKLMQPEMSSYQAAETLGLGLSPLLWGDAPAIDPYSPSDGVHYFDDFQGSLDPTSTHPWTITQVDTKGSISHEAAAAGGVIQFTSATGDSADDGITAQKKNIAVTPAAGTNIWFEARVKVDQADEQWAFGLAEVDTTIIAAGVWDDVSDKILFGHHTGTADKIDLVVANGATEDDTADAADMTDDTWVTLGFKLTGLTKIEFYVNGVLTETGTTTAALPNAAMVLTAVAQYEAADVILSVDWVKIIASAGRDA